MSRAREGLAGTENRRVGRSRLGARRSARRVVVGAAQWNLTTHAIGNAEKLVIGSTAYVGVPGLAYRARTAVRPHPGPQAIGRCYPSGTSVSLMVEQPRRALTREQVVNTAVELIDDVGLDAFSVRTLATRLGVTPMAIYWHVSDKDDLLTAVLDSVLAEIDGTDLPEAPFDALLEVGRRYRACFARHPRVAPLLAERPSPEGPAAAALMAATVELLRAAGLDDAAAASGYVLLAQFVMGAVLIEHDPDHRLPPQLASAGLGVLPDPDARFEFGLAVLLDGLRARLS